MGDRARPRNKKQQVVLRKDLMRLFNGSCILCGERITCRLTVEHLVPHAHGGSDRKENLAPAHWVCNHIRGSGSFVRTSLYLEEVRDMVGRKTFCRWIHMDPFTGTARLPDPSTSC